MKRDKSKLPQHVAIIMDGNRRWAKKKGRSAIGGHNYVIDEVIGPIVDRCIELGISHLTLWAFSTENWNRDKIEIEGIMKLFRRALQRKVEDLYKKGARLKILGELSRFPKDIEKKAKEWIETSKNNKKITVAFGLNYGGRDEILRAVKKMVNSDDFSVNQITEEKFSAFLDTADMPDADLIIRTGGQFRLSGFMPWQSIYSELYFTDVLMPEFNVHEFDKALGDFGKRTRRFGGGKFENYKK